MGRSKGVVVVVGCARGFWGVEWWWWWCVWCAVCGGGGASLSCSMGIPTLDRLFFIKGVPG